VNTHLHHISVYTHVHILGELSIDESWVTNVECVYTLMHDIFVEINEYIHECVYTHTLYRHTYVNHMYENRCVVFAYICVYSCVCVHTYAYIHICVYSCVCVYTYNTSISIHVVYIRV